VAPSSGRVAEWSNAAVLKTAEPETVPGVRIPPLPPSVPGLRTIESLVRSNGLCKIMLINERILSENK
jgi:hypothetical protein